MRINQGMTLLLIGILGLIVFNLYDWNNSIFYFVVGVGLARINDYWGK
jgi:hypothetical protein